MVWRYRISAAANRRALHPNYTSATEKTLTPLNGQCARAQNPSRFAAMHDARLVERNTRAPQRRPRATDFGDTSKTLVTSAFSRMSAMQLHEPLHVQNFSVAHLHNSANGSVVSVLPRSKFFSTAAPKTALRDGREHQKRANRPNPIRHRRSCNSMPRLNACVRASDLASHRHATIANGIPAMIVKDRACSSATR